MAIQNYECMVIFDANRYARDPQGVTDRFQKIVAKFGGDVLVSRLWNEQKLAYPIKNHRKGVYWLTYFRFESTQLAEFRRACQLNDDIVRSMVLKIDPRLIDALVAHAKGEAPKLVDSEGLVIADELVGEDEGGEEGAESDKEESFA